MNQELERHYIRHPSDVPIAWSLDEITVGYVECLKNVSEGGLAFISQTEVSQGALVAIQIPAIDAQLVLKGSVVWCSPTEDGQFEVGVRFIDANHHFCMRMIEQICHIEHFKNETFANEGRIISGEEAALEWIRRYAPDFPE